MWQTRSISWVAIRLESSELLKPIQFVKGVGPHIAALLRQKDVITVEDALYYLPRAYEDRRHFKKLKDLVPGKRETAFGAIQRVALQPIRTRKQPMLVMTLADPSGIILATWFRYNAKYMMTRYKVGMHVVFSGEIRVFNFQKGITHPDLEIIDNPHVKSLHFGRIVPIYSLTEGLYQKTLRRILKNVLDLHLKNLEDPLPKEILKRYELPDLPTSFQLAHFPEELFPEKARKRLVFDEFFFLELGLALKREKSKKEKTMAFPPSERLKPKILNQLKFTLTDSQKIVLKEIEDDLSRTTPMNRLLQGDVGSGKTIVALISALSIIERGCQTALMVPTEILAEQHYENIKKLLSPLTIDIALLKSDLKKSDKETLIEEINAGKYGLVIGTHALIEEGVRFKNLSYIIIDEQHRFGVEQRLSLRQKGNCPHLLVMTATPIPRTLALTVYGDLDLSIMTGLPPGRKPAATKVLFESDRLKLYQFMKKEILRGRQAYVVYPLIEESEKIDLKDASSMTEHLKRIFPKFRVELIHGKMKSDEKNKIMSEFKENQIQILVSTTVIEVGIDVKNSSIMVVEHAERFGLSQLHQLRGRIGRGEDNAYCFLVAQAKKTDEAKERLSAMEKFQSGFKIAEIDLKLRGPGVFMGKEQSGLSGFRVANIATDGGILLQARKEAFDLVSKDPDFKFPEHAPLKKALTTRWQQKFNLISAG